MILACVVLVGQLSVTDTWTDISVISKTGHLQKGSRKLIAELRGITCHMGSHCVTCHPTEVSVPHFNCGQTGWYSIYLPRRDGRLSWVWCWLYTDTVYLSANSHPFTWVEWNPVPLCSKSPSIGLHSKLCVRPVINKLTRNCLSSVTKGRLDGPCLDNGVCVIANSVCDNGQCVCADDTFDNEGFCGKKNNFLSVRY